MDEIEKNQLIGRLFEEVEELPTSERIAYLIQNCSDVDVRNDVLEMLKQSDLGLSDILGSTGSYFGAKETNDFSQLPVSNQFKRHGLINPRHKGLGVVFKALQVQTERFVALKYIRSSHALKLGELAQFKEEIKNLAQLNHENIARIYEAYEVDSVPFFAMELVENGEPITQYCADNRLSIPERVALFLQVCKAITHSHQKNIVHRDLKPSNILVVSDGDKHIVKVIDFGLACQPRGLDGNAGQICGTLTYMSPEQSSGTEAIDTSTDIFSLGSILQELIIGRNHLGDQHSKIRHYLDLRKFYSAKNITPLGDELEKIPNEEILETTGITFANKRAHHAFAKSDLAWIIDKCLKFNSGKRYLAAILQLDIENYLAGLPIEARKPHRTTYVMQKWAKRRPVFVALLLVVFLLGLAVIESMRRTNVESNLRSKDALEAAATERTLRTESDRNRDNALKGFETLAGIFDKLDIRTPPKSFSDWTAAFSNEISLAGDTLNKELFDDSISYAKMLGRFSNVLVGLGDGKNAVALSEKCLTVFESRSDIVKSDKVRARYDFGGALLTNFDYPKAAEQFLICLDEMEDSPDLYGIDTFRCQANLATSYMFSSKPKEAIALLSTAIPKLAEELGESHKETLTARGNLANCELELGNYKKAKNIFEELIPIFSKLHGTKYYGTLITQINYAGCLNRLGDYENSSRILSKVVPLARIHLGSQHPYTVTGISRYSKSLSELGQTSEALAMLKTIDVERYRTLDQRSATLVMGHLHSLSRDYDKAIKIQRYAWESSKDSNDIELQLTCQNNLALAYLDAKQFSAAIDVLEKLTNHSEKERGSEAPETLRFLGNLALAHTHAGNIKKADKLYLRLLEASPSNLNYEEHRIRVKNYIGLLQYSGRRDEGIVVLKQLINLLEKNLEENNPVLDICRVNLATDLVANQQHAQAEKFTCLYSELTFEQLRAKGPRFVKAVGFLGVQYYNMREYSKSIPIFEKILSIKISQAKDEGDKAILLAKLNLGNNYFESGKTKECISLLEDAYSYIDKYPELEARGVRNSLCAAYLKSNMGAKASKIIDEILAPTRAKHKDNLGMLVYSLGAVASKLTNSGGYAKADELLTEAIELIEDQQPSFWRHPYCRTMLGRNFCLDALSRTKEQEKAIVSNLLQKARTNLVEGYHELNNNANLPFDAKAKRKMLIPIAKDILTVIEATGEKDESTDWPSVLKRLESEREQED